MFLFLIALHVVVCILLVVVVLLQSGKGGGLAGAFGGPGGAGQSFFGGRGAATFLSKATVALGGLYFLSSISLALITATQASAPRSLIQQEAQQQLPSQGDQPPSSPAGQPATGQPATETPQGATPQGNPETQPQSQAPGDESSGP